jgi:hypothetical protein
MMLFEGKNKFITGVSTELEWAHLVNETFVGEAAVVPLLLEIASDPRISKPLKDDILRQAEDEINHTEMYRKVVASYNLKGTGFEKPLSEVISSQKKITLKLFAIQGVLEGIALGSLIYRTKYWENSPSYAEDQVALRDEISHVRLSYPHMRELIKIEGLPSTTEMRQITRDINKIFRDATNINIIKENLKDHMPSDQEISINQNAHKVFGKLSIDVLKRNIESFTRELNHHAKNS